MAGRDEGSRRLLAIVGPTASGKTEASLRVAERLDISVETVLRWTRRGELPGFRLPGGAIRHREAKLEAWLAGRAVGRRNGADDVTPV